MTFPSALPSPAVQLSPASAPAGWHVVVLYNQPTLPTDHPDYAAEAGVLESVAAVEQALVAGGYRVSPLGVGESPAASLGELPSLRPDVVFNLCEGLRGVSEGEAQIAGMVELLGVPLTGSPSSALALVRDKARTKWLLAGAGLPTAEFCRIGRGQSADLAPAIALLAGGPVIVKPATEDASLGITPASVVDAPAALAASVRSVAARYGDVLVERFIAGREFNAALVGWPEAELLPLAEIEFDPALSARERLVTYDAKWIAGGTADRATPPRCPANIAADLAARLSAAARGAFMATGCRDYARVDLRVDARGDVFILEVNGNPDIGPSAGLARAWAVAGRSYAELATRLVEQARSRRA